MLSQNFSSGNVDLCSQPQHELQILFQGVQIQVDVSIPMHFYVKRNAKHITSCTGEDDICSMEIELSAVSLAVSIRKTLWIRMDTLVRQFICKLAGEDYFFFHFLQAW